MSAAATKNLREAAVLCPHIASDEAPLVSVDGAVINIDPDHPLILCGQCWQIVRASVYDSIMVKAARIILTHK